MRYVSGLAVRCLLLYGFSLFAWQARTLAQDSLVPAGTLLHCALEETTFSSATAAIGDPVLCHLSSLQEFGRTVFPRGSYLGGHLEADKEPGHFVGKRYLRLVFDRIYLPNTDVPVPIKVVSARGYRVDREGDIVGHGHAKRDTAELILPPLWPWKVITLPAKGPRPSFKGEEQLTLRLMEDATVPRMTPGADGHSLGGNSGPSSENLSKTPQFPSFGYLFVPGSPTGKVKFETPMRNVVVYVDGGFVGTVDKLSTLKLRTGLHDIELRARDGYPFYQNRVNVAAGKTLKITP
jgi:hypothetical protein